MGIEFSLHTTEESLQDLGREFTSGTFCVFVLEKLEMNLFLKVSHGLSRKEKESKISDEIGLYIRPVTSENKMLVLQLIKTIDEDLQLLEENPEQKKSTEES